MTDDEWLQERISDGESGKEGRQLETYTDSVLGGSQPTLCGERKVLGVQWETVSDQIVLGTEELASIAKQIKPSKCQVVSTVSCFYDPLGILRSLGINLFREIC